MVLLFGGSEVTHVFQAVSELVSEPCAYFGEVCTHRCMSRATAARLKRLIDRDAQALRSNPKAVLQEGRVERWWRDVKGIEV